MAEPEQITAVPVEETPVKIKDPKKVAAGKALAARNKAAREAQKKLNDLETNSSSLSLNNVMQVAAVVGAGFTLYHGYQVVKPYLNSSKKEAYERLVEVTYHVREEKKPEPEKNEIKGIDME